MGRELLRITLLASPIPAIKLAWHWPLPTSWYTALMMDGDQSRYQVRLRQQHELCILCSHPAIVSAGLLSFSSVVQALSLSRLVAWYMTKDFSWWDLTWSSTVLVWPTLSTSSFVTRSVNGIFTDFPQRCISNCTLLTAQNKISNSKFPKLTTASVCHLKKTMYRILFFLHAKLLDYCSNKGKLYGDLCIRFVGSYLKI